MSTQTVTYKYIPPYVKLPILTPVANWFHQGDRKWFHIVGYGIAVAIAVGILISKLCPYDTKDVEIKEGLEAENPIVAVLQKAKTKKQQSTCSSLFNIINILFGLMMLYTWMTWIFGVRYF